MAHLFEDRPSMTAGSFAGFEPVAHLRASRLAAVPEKRGVYMVVREVVAPPVFLPSNPGGRFKGRDPTVAASVLGAAWVASAKVLYIGKAGGAASAATLRSRLTQLLDFGAGRPVGHWGGRYLWQVDGINDAVVCWRECPQHEPATIKSGLIADFAAIYGKRPFANLRD
jgi:hypothetical protein